MLYDAEFSVDRMYRYSLKRLWNEHAPRLCFIMLNPSTADATRNDPTITRCITRAINGGYGSLIVGNVFAYRSTYPQDLYKAVDPIGPLNNEAIIAMCQSSERVICAWGNHGKFRNHDEVILHLIKASGRQPYALEISKQGCPKHPLHIAYAITERLM